MIKYALSIFCVLAMLVPAGANAEPFTAEAQQDFQEALAYWHEPVVCSELVTEFVAPPLMLDGHEIWGGFGREGCFIEVITGLSPCQLKDTIYHEVGHATGHEHTTQPGSFMSTDVNDKAISQPFCEAEIAQQEAERRAANEAAEKTNERFVTRLVRRLERKWSRRHHRWQKHHVVHQDVIG